MSTRQSFFPCNQEHTVSLCFSLSGVIWLFFSICLLFIFMSSSLMPFLTSFPRWFTLVSPLFFSAVPLLLLSQCHIYQPRVLTSIIQLVYFITLGHTSHLLPDYVSLLTRISSFFYYFKRFILH